MEPQRRVYEVGEIDAFAAYCAELDRCFFIPFDFFGRRSQIVLRLDGTKNNQKLGINWADDFEFEVHFARSLGP